MYLLVGVRLDRHYPETFVPTRSFGGFALGRPNLEQKSAKQNQNLKWLLKDDSWRAGNLMDMATGAFLIYDADCAFCQKSANWGTKSLKYFPPLVASKSIHPASYGLSSTDVASRIWLIDGQNKLGGHKAAAWILSKQPHIFIRALAPLVASPLGRLGYALVAKNRHRLPGAEPACAIEPAATKPADIKEASA